MYLREENSPLPDWFRLDNAKVIVLPKKFSWKERPVALTVSVGKHIPPRALQWLKQFALQHQRPLMYTEQKIKSTGLEKNQQFLAFGPPLFRQEIETMVERRKEFMGINMRLECFCCNDGT